MYIFKRFALPLILAFSTVLSLPATLYAASPVVHVNCGLPHGGIVACSLYGRAFRAAERLQLTYSITFTSLPRIHGRLQEKVYRRTTTTDRHGGFTRPPLTFGVTRYHESFRLNVTAIGTYGDRASTTYVAIAQ